MKKKKKKSNLIIYELCIRKTLWNFTLNQWNWISSFANWKLHFFFRRICRLDSAHLGSVAGLTSKIEPLTFLIDEKTKIFLFLFCFRFLAVSRLIYGLGTCGRYWYSGQIQCKFLFVLNKSLNHFLFYTSAHTSEEKNNNYLKLASKANIEELKWFTISCDTIKLCVWCNEKPTNQKKK